MLIEVKGLHGATLHALDGEIGSVDEILFDDEHWTVRYLVVNTGSWLFGRKVLISPMACGLLDWERHSLNINLTREQIKNSPAVDTDKPLSRQWETDYYAYYGWPYYWGGMGAWGSAWYPGGLLALPFSTVQMVAQEANRRAQDPSSTHLRSTKEITGYGVSATDGHLGHIADFIVDDETWRIGYLAVDTRDWWPGKKVLLPPDWIGNVNWPDSMVTVNVSRDQVRNAPEWNPGQPISPAVEPALHSGHKGRLSGEAALHDHVDVEFQFRGHRVQVSHENVPMEWLGDSDTVFTVLIDGSQTVVPGIWKAFKADGDEGVTLVLKAFLDRLPVHTA